MYNAIHITKIRIGYSCTYEVLNWDEPRFPPAYPRYVQRVDDRRPQELERERPEGEAEAGLLLVADLPVRQDERDGGREPERYTLWVT